MNRKLSLGIEIVAWASVTLGLLMLLIYLFHWTIQWLGEDNLQALDCLSC